MTEQEIENRREIGRLKAVQRAIERDAQREITLARRREIARARRENPGLVFETHERMTFAAAPTIQGGGRTWRIALATRNERDKPDDVYGRWLAATRLDMDQCITVTLDRGRDIRSALIGIAFMFSD